MVFHRAAGMGQTRNPLMLGKLLTPFIKLFKGIFTGRHTSMRAAMEPE